MRRPTARFFVSCALAVSMLAALAVSASAAAPTRYIYFGDGYSVSRAPVGANATKEVLVGTVATASTSVPSKPQGVVLDRGASRIYWVSLTEEAIRSSKLDGTDVQILNIGSADVGQVRGLQLDAKKQRLVWLNQNSGTFSFVWASLSGSGASGTYGPPVGAIASPDGLGLDPLSGQLFWANKDPGNADDFHVSGTESGDHAVGVGIDGADGCGSPGLAADYAHSANGHGRTVFSFNACSNVVSAYRVGVNDGYRPIAGGVQGMNDPDALTYDPVQERVVGTMVQYGQLNGVGSDPDLAPYDQYADVDGVDAHGRVDFSGAGHLTASNPLPELKTSIGGSVSGVIHLINDGNYPLNVFGSTFSSSSLGGGAGCAGYLEIDQECDLTVTFSPATSGALTGSATLATDAGDFSFAVSGSAPEIPVAHVDPLISKVKAVTRCSSKGNAGNLSVVLTSATSTATTATLQRTSTQRKSLPRKCPPRATGNTGFVGKGIGKKKSAPFKATAGTQSKNMDELFGVKTLSPGRYRLAISYIGASGLNETRTTSFWVLSK